jgi:PAS domain S-box-containing protein
MLSAMPDAERRVLLIMDHSLDFVELLGAEGVIKGVSGAIRSLAGYEPDELKGYHYQDLLHPEDCGRAATYFARVLHGERPEPILLRYRRKDATWRNLRVSARNFLDDPGVRAIVVLTRDETEQIHAENSLSQANSDLRRLSKDLINAQEGERRYIAGELHDDVQQILVGLRLSMEASLRQAPQLLPGKSIEIWISHVQEVIEHLHDLTMKLRVRPIGEHGLRTELCHYVENLTLAEGQNLRLELGDEWGPAAADVDLACLRIIQEGISNAIKYSGAKHLNVSLLKTDGHLTVSVCDDGVGFDVASAQARAADNATVGLLSMRERATLAGGRLTIISSMGHGTRVSATFP